MDGLQRLVDLLTQALIAPVAALVGLLLAALAWVLTR